RKAVEKWAGGRGAKRERGIANGPVAGAAAEVAGKLMGVARACAAGAVVLGEQAHHEARSAVAALRTAGLGEGALRRGEVSIDSERLDRVNLLASRHGEEHEAAIEGAVSTAGLMARHLNYRAGAAFSFGAAFFG